MSDKIMWDRLDPELVEPFRGVLGAMQGGLDFNDIPGQREMLAGLIAAVAAEAPPIEGVDAEDLSIPGPDGAPDVPIRLYRPAGLDARLPAVLWMHAGGWALGDLAMDDLMCRQLAKDTRCAVVAVEYRLAPEHPYPAALEDCHATLRWLATNAAEVALDPARIAVAGASAGGNLAAGLALLARDRGGPGIAFQLLVYPSVDDGNVAPADASHPDTIFWTRENHRLAWRAYLGAAADKADVPAYAAPSHAADLTGLPPAYIAVGGLDLFVDDDTRYACRLSAAGVPTELHVFPAACHAFDAFAPGAAISQRFVAERNAALRHALGA